MATQKVILIANLEILDTAEYRQYEKGFFPILKKYDGEFITFDDNSITFEGSNPPQGRVILFQFPSAEAAQNWYNDADYQTLSEHRRAGTQLNFLTMIKA